MENSHGFFDFLRLDDGARRSNEEIVRAIVPLMEQVQAHHDRGRVAPLEGVEKIFADAGCLWFRDADALQPRVSLAEIRKRERSHKLGIDVVGRSASVQDLDTGLSEYSTRLVGDAAQGIEFPVYLPGYVSWEQELDHHDPLTDIFGLGMLFASLALALDFSERDELERFVAARHNLRQLSSSLHPVLAKAIMRMTELDRRVRIQDLPALIETVRGYRDVADPGSLRDFSSLKGVESASRSSKRGQILSELQSRLFDVSRRNRLIWYKPTLQTLDLTEGSVPTSLHVESITVQELLLWDGAVKQALTEQKPLHLERYLDFEDKPYLRGSLDKIKAQAQRDEAEFGFSQLNLVVAFFNWHNLRDSPDERIRSPLLLLPVKLEKKRGVRDSYVVTALSEVAEINPAVRYCLKELYSLELPEQVNLSEVTIDEFHQALSGAIAASEPGITLRCLRKPQIELVQKKARRRLDAWRRRSKVSGRGIAFHGDVSYSYSKSNFQPLGLELFRRKVKPEELDLEQHFEAAALLKELRERTGDACDDSEENVKETSHEAYRLTEEATGRYDWALDLTHLTLGNFNYRKMSLVRDYDALAKRPDDTSLPAFERLFSLDARDVAQPPSGSTEPLAPYVVVPADPTQTAALHWARAGSDFIIQGPPGTGKSQTITNLIADFAGQGKRVLFVCEKRAALDVVFARLAKLGLDEVALLIHDSQTDKRGFIAELGATYERHVASLEQAKPDRQSERSGVLQRMDEPLEALRAFAGSMLEPARGTSASVAELLTQRLQLGDVEALAPEVEELLPDHGVWQSGREAVLDLARALREVGESTLLLDLPLVRVARGVLEHDRPLNELRDRVVEVRKTLERVQQVGASLPLDNTAPTIDELRQAVALAESLEELARHGGLELLDPASDSSQALSDAQRIHAERSRALSKAQEATRSWRNKLPASDVGPALEQARRLQTVFILFLLFMPVWWRLRRVLRESYDFGAHQIAPTWTAILEALSQEYERANELEEVDLGVKERFADATLSEMVNLAEHARSDTNKTPLQLALRERWANDPAAPLTELLGVGNALSALEEASARVFTDVGGSSVEELSELCESVSQASDLLPPLLAPLRALFDVDVSVRRAVLSVRLEPQHWDAAIASAALARTFRENRPLARFEHDSLQRRCQQLQANYSEWLASNAEAVRAAVRERFQQHLKLSAQPKSALSNDEVQLKQAYTAGRRVLEREFKKVMRHKSIRELSSGDTGTVLYDLKPVWLMSPLSISDTINPEEQRFDVVIFDEASQIPLEEAVPVVCRAPQMIVVGDEMQLPPTTFFAGRREVDEASLPSGYDLDAESFLTHAAQKLPSTMLGWHYRSRYEALIRFSNQAFYGGKLLTVPDRELSERREALVVEQVSDGAGNAAELLRRPISYHRLKCGVYASRRNLAEAEYIAELIRALLKSEPRQSIGVVAFSEAQQDAIEDALRRLAEQDSDFQSSLEAEYEREEDGQLVGLFVKNLENVQGDERDVIILSVCYGPDARGKMLMNFGPINKGGGEKRLNVVFSRAKRHMAVVASINYSAITNEYNEGANCLRRYLQYAEAVSVGDLEVARVASDALNTLGETTQEDAHHPVVEQLAAQLRRRGHTVELNVGSSGFQVDLALSVEGRRVLAVLVDTPRHYAVRNIMDSYHMRPSVLRSFGWGVEWVLSKDWYAEPDACVRRVEAALESLIAGHSESGEALSDSRAAAADAATEQENSEVPAT